MSDWVLTHWPQISGAIGLAVSIRVFPNFWRGLIRALASPVLLGIEREIRMAREEQVADLLEQIEDLKRDSLGG